MKIGILTYESLYCNFTNYGTVLQAWALAQAVARLGDQFDPVLINYCPESMEDKDPLEPIKNMWDTDSESRKMCELSLPAIKANYEKIEFFYYNKMQLSDQCYTNKNIDTVIEESISRFICGSDSIWDNTEFGMDRAFFADYPTMQGNAIAYAPSFQDSFYDYSQEQYDLLIKYLNNFTAIGIRDEAPINFISGNVRVPVQRVVDPTLLLRSSDYDEIIAPRQEEKRYLLYYSRRYNKAMEDFVEKTALEKKLEVIEISLRYTNREKHRMFYEAGIEEFLSLVKYADCIITNSFHCLIFALHFEKDFYAFTREHCNNKIYELLARLNLEGRLCTTGCEEIESKIDYLDVKERLEKERLESLEFLKRQLNAVCKE